MSEQDRMDRARRIRLTREGRRPDEDADGPESEDPDGDGSTEGSTDEESTAGDQAGDGESAGDATAPVDDAVAAAVERVSNATASVPDPEELNETIDAAGGVTSGETRTAGADGPGATEATEQTAGPETDSVGETDAAVGATVRAGIGARRTDSEPETRVLEFTLDDAQYCLDIEYIEEIVKREGITRVPNTPGFVEGVVDLRGQITTIINPKVVIGTDDQSRGDLLVVFDGETFDEQGHLGWVVDEVRRVSPVREDEVNDSPVEGDHIEGVIDRGDDEEFVVWTSPEFLLDEAT